MNTYKCIHTDKGVAMRTATTVPSNTRRRPTRRESPKVETLRPGESVVIDLAGRTVERLNAWAGTVVAVDAVAVRIAAEASRFTLSWGHAEGERVIPWSRIARVTVTPPKGEA